MFSNANCVSKNHKMHICALKESGYDTNNTAEFKKLAAGPQYKCGHCGAQAHNKENLCNPKKL